MHIDIITSSILCMSRYELIRTDNEPIDMGNRKPKKSL